MAQIIDGKAIASEIRETIKNKIQNSLQKPGLAVVLVGENPASKVYVSMKEVACEKAGLFSQKFKLDKSVSEQYLLDLVDNLNKDPKIHGILVQLPLPSHINENKIIQRISPEKDVDGFHPISQGNLFIGTNKFIPCTPKGIIKLIESATTIEGKNAVVIGRSNIVGKPVAQLLLQKNATVTICHSRTQNIKEISKQADILVVAIGKPKFVNREYVKPGAVVIDVGVNRVDNDSEKGYYLCGDVDFEDVKDIASHITPVPGGVGPMTIAMLLQNTLEAFENKNRTPSVKKEKINIAAMCSTNGTDLDAIINAINNNELNVNLSLIFANKECGAIEKAKRHNIKYTILESKGRDREEYDKEVIEVLQQHNIDLILLIGYMRFLSKHFTDTFRNKIMNIHPSLLPAFAGGMDKNVHQEILNHGCRVTGCTLHFVDETADMGPIIMQKAVPVENNDTVDTLKEKVQKAEQEVFIEAIKAYSEDRISIEGRSVNIK